MAKNVINAAQVKTSNISCDMPRVGRGELLGLFIFPYTEADKNTREPATPTGLLQICLIIYMPKSAEILHIFLQIREFGRSCREYGQGEKKQHCFPKNKSDPAKHKNNSNNFHHPARAKMGKPANKLVYHLKPISLTFILY
jgi:hypothetical protein